MAPMAEMWRPWLRCGVNVCDVAYVYLFFLQLLILVVFFLSLLETTFSFLIEEELPEGDVGFFLWATATVSLYVVMWGYVTLI